MSVFILLFGIIIGSFLNVCIFRIPRNESIIYPASHCTNCHTSLKPLDLIPIFSYLFLKGRCKYCKTKISVRYPLIELLTGIIYLLLFLKYDLSIYFFFYIFLASILIVIAFIDYDHKIIPDKLVLLSFLGGLVYILVLFFTNKPINLSDNLFGFLVGGGLFLLLAVLSNGGMGGGDIKLMAVLGMWFGLKGILLIIFLSFFIGALFCVPLLIFKRCNRKQMIPFGPFIIIASLINIFFGDEIITMYLNFVL